MRSGLLGLAAVRRPCFAAPPRHVCALSSTRSVLGLAGPRRPTRFAPAPALALPPPAVLRHFSAAAAPGGSEDDIDEEKQKKLRQYNIASVAMGVGAVATISYGMHKLVSTFMHIDFTTVAWVGFTTGFLSAALSGGGALSVYRWLEIRPQVVYKHVMGTIRA